MSELDNLFDEASVVSLDTDDDWLIVDNEFRTIKIPKCKKLLGVTSDQRVNVLNFKVPRYYGEIDLGEFEFRINYLNANGEGDIYAVTYMEIDSEYITFSWTVGRHACKYNGEVSFVICARTFQPGTDPPVIDREYNTAIHKLPVILGIEVDEAVYSANYDLIEQFLQAIKTAENIESLAHQADESANNASNSETNAHASEIITVAAKDEAITILDQVKRILYQMAEVTGNPIVIDDGGDGIPVSSLVVYIDPTQTGSGTPSSSNIRPFIGKLGCSVERSRTGYDEPLVITESWGDQIGVIYGGFMNFTTGVLSVYPYYASYNGEELVGPWVSSMDEYDPEYSPTLGASVVDMGGTPIQYQLAPHQITTLYENNYFVTDGSGGMNLVYYTKYGTFRLG